LNVISFSGGFAIAVKNLTGSDPAIRPLPNSTGDPGEIEKNGQDQASCTGSPVELGKGLKININTLLRARKIFQHVL